MLKTVLAPVRGLVLGATKVSELSEVRDILAERVKEWTRELKAEGKADTLFRQLGRRFKALPPGIEEQVRAASIDQLDEWCDRILDARTLEDVFDPDPRH